MADRELTTRDLLAFDLAKAALAGGEAEKIAESTFPERVFEKRFADRIYKLADALFERGGRP